MRCIHQLSESLNVSLIELFHRLRGAGVFIDRVFRTFPAHRIRNCAAQLFKLCRLELTKRLEFRTNLLQILQRRFTLPAAVVVRGICQLMRLICIHNHKLRVADRKGRVLIFQRRRIQENSHILPSHSGSKLIHDPAVHSDKAILGDLPELCVSDLILLKTVQPHQCLPGKHLKRRA